MAVFAVLVFEISAECYDVVNEHGRCVWKQT